MNIPSDLSFLKFINYPSETTRKSPPDVEDVERVSGALFDALLRYRKGPLSALLSEVVFVGRLNIRGTPFLGLARPDHKEITIAVRDQTSSRQAVSTLHHEIGHLVEGNSRFPKAEWLALSEEFSGPFKGEYKNPREWYLERGFITAYGSKNRHEDFAEYVELMFEDEAQLNRFAKKYPRVAAKAALVRKVYADMRLLA